MQKEKFKKILLEKKGYLKKGNEFLANKYNISIEDVKEVKFQIKNNQNENVQISTYRAESIIGSKFSQPVSELRYSNRITTPGTYWVTGCVHAPFHNKAMYDAVYNYISKEVDLSGIILAGDIIDANSLSAHDRGNIALPGVNLDWEYQEANKFLNDIDLFTDNVYYLYGNHEDRYNRLMRSSDASKYGDALLSPIEGLKLEKRGYKVFTDWKNDVISVGKHLDINHGEFCNVHTAKKTIDTYRKSMMYFHTHRFQIFMEGMNGGFNMGAGADFNSKVFGYATRAMKASWVNASALVTLDEQGMFHVQPLVWMNDRLIVNGKEY